MSFKLFPRLNCGDRGVTCEIAEYVEQAQSKAVKYERKPLRQRRLQIKSLLLGGLYPRLQCLRWKHQGLPDVSRN